MGIPHGTTVVPVPIVLEKLAHHPVPDSSLVLSQRKGSSIADLVQVILTQRKDITNHDHHQ